MTALADLAHARRWTAWRNDEREGDLVKVPYQAVGRRSASDDPSTWLTQAEASAVADAIVNGTGGGVGVWLGDHGGAWLAGIDLDSCRDRASGDVEVWARDVLARFESYAEVSPSGTGLKTFFLVDREDVATLRQRMGAEHGRQFKAGSGKHPPAVELYLSRRYFAATWEGLEDAPADLRTVPLNDLLWLVEEFGPRFAGKVKDERPSSDSGSDDILHRLNRAASTNRLVEVALRNAITRQGGSRSEGALGLGAALARAGWSFADMKAALLACAATADWAREKVAEGDRQFERIWQRGADNGDGSDGSAQGEGTARDNPQASTALHIVDPADLACAPVPRRAWIVEDWLGVGYVTGQYGDGGVGKGMTAQGLQTATAADVPWLGRMVTRCPSIGLYCEDDEDELHRRQVRICAALDIGLRDLTDMRWISGVGHDNTFVSFDATGRMLLTDRFHQFAEAAQRHNAKLIVLDNVADLYGGSENDRNQVRRFINVLNRLALDLGAAVLLNCHPSRAGLNSGSLDGGSTAWNNSMRSRWTLAKVKSDHEDEDDGERLLSRAKGNYAPDGGSIRLRWVNGVLAPVAANGGVAGATGRAHAEMVFLDLLDRCTAQGVRVSESANARNYAARIFSKRPDRQGYSAKDFERAMHALFTARRIRVVEYRRSNRQMAHAIAREDGGAQG